MPSIPQARSLIAFCRSPDHSMTTPDGIDLYIRIGLEVEPLCGLSRTPAVHSHGDEIPLIIEVSEHHTSFLAATTPCCGETHDAPTVTSGAPQSESTACHPIQPAMCPAREAYEPRWGKPCLVFLS